MKIKMSNKTQSKIMFFIFLTALGFIFFPMFSGKLSVHDRDNVAYPESDPFVAIKRVGSETLPECE